MAYWLWFRGLTVFEGSAAAPLLFIQPLLGTVLAVWLLDDRLTWATVAGGALILLSMILVLRGGAGAAAPEARGGAGRAISVSRAHKREDMMYIGALQLTLRIPLSASLKDKRQVVQSVLQRVRNKFEVAAAEIATLESWQVATIGVSCISNSARHTEDVLEHVRRYIEETRPDVEVTDEQLEVITMDW